MKKYTPELKSAFSLMEMMIVLLIVAIIAAASAPMVTRKMARNSGSGDSPFVFTGTDNTIAFPNNTGRTLLGTTQLLQDNNVDVEAVLTLNARNGENPTIAFGENSNYRGSIEMNQNSVVITQGTNTYTLNGTGITLSNGTNTLNISSNGNTMNIGGIRLTRTSATQPYTIIGNCKLTTGSGTYTGTLSIPTVSSNPQAERPNIGDLERNENAETSEEVSQNKFEKVKALK